MRTKLIIYLVPVLFLTVAGCQTSRMHRASEEPPLQFERGFPTAGTIEKVYDASDLRRAIEAYKPPFVTAAANGWS